MDYRPIKSTLDTQLASSSRRKLRAEKRARRLPFLRALRSAEHSKDRQHASRQRGRQDRHHAADQTVPRRKNGVRLDFLKLQEVIPYSWMLDPTPLPQHAVIPRLEIHDWREAAKLSQKKRDLLIKVSGFSPLGWGSRGIVVGSDVPQVEWEREIEEALATFQTTPRVMRRFHKARLLDHPYWDNDTGEVKTMRGRVRLCPYYFVENAKVKLSGALARIFPADKKLLHGMSDAILAPAGFEPAAGSADK